MKIRFADIDLFLDLRKYKRMCDMAKQAANLKPKVVLDMRFRDRYQFSQHSDDLWPVPKS